MKLWDVLATCLLLLSSVSTRPIFPKLQPVKRPPVVGLHRDSAALSVEDSLIHPYSHPERLHKTSMEQQYELEGPYPDQFDDVMDFIEATIGRLRRSLRVDGSSQGRSGRQRQSGSPGTDKGDRGDRGGRKGRGGRRRGQGRKGGRSGKGGREEQRTATVGRGCLLREVHLNVTDLGLGYQTKEELIFRYCSGPCSDAETNYDKILNNLTNNKKLDKEKPSRVCCRPIAFDDDLSFLDNNLEYHILKKHSARKCGCV
ncbi:LOW QUALITY PROTEIN: glial cell line-derived neurotrophic factor-like [Alosa alosa]|uniref:LOW QUALITY PROTEIN: glial cell line-derived neurotrophic factor-like n=1 Tax=Alosa alosa TaxID=278164 RepID=UPI00201528CF|nr:LOW QUALITY PROTEIN: glial cell line-derived neurotrophic factor-like [Alosa alosa]